LNEGRHVAAKNKTQKMQIANCILAINAKTEEANGLRLAA
jgi:hypothetical protein